LQLLEECCVCVEEKKKREDWGKCWWIMKNSHMVASK
jgi:hypothetical protein